MESIDYNHSSLRSEKARIGILFSQNILMFLSILVPVFLALGGLFIYLGSSIGWVLIGFSVIPAMVVEWRKGELHHIDIVKGSDSIDNILSGEILGRISRKPTPREIAEIISGLPSGYFFATRFGISSSFLVELASNDPDDMPRLWQEALQIRKQTDSYNMSAPVLIAAIIRCAPNGQTLLSRLQLDIEDVIRGINWYNHLRDLIEHHRKPRKTGGIARDWSFGWTPLLNRFGQNLSKLVGSYSTSAFELIAHEELLDQIIDIFNKNGRQNAVIVGQPGVGKTEIVNAFASRLMDGAADIPDKLRFRQVFSLDSASIIAAAPDRGGLELLVPQILAEAYRAKNIIICLDNAQLFFEDGVGSIDISNVLLPILEAGGLRIILTVDEQRFLQISKRNPDLVNVLNRIAAAPADKNQTIAIMQDQSINIEFQSSVTFMYQAIVEAYRLGDRYIHDRAMPGKAIKILESAANYSKNGLVSAESVRQAIEKTLDIKVSVATDSVEREKLLNLEELIHERMINQVRAVKVVSDALRRARAGVRNLNRPIGTFLFLGPTGVGKTELAKSLAEIYFDGEDRIIRVDMNEYVGADDVKRLIADGVENTNSLTARVMKQPFSVILLDEIEKAHGNVMSTLLQMLDEGILRDVKNREVSFRDAIIIATSNAGADRIREYIDRGYDIVQFEAKFIDELIPVFDVYNNQFLIIEL